MVHRKCDVTMLLTIASQIGRNYSKDRNKINYVLLNKVLGNRKHIWKDSVTKISCQRGYRITDKSNIHF